MASFVGLVRKLYLFCLSCFFTIVVMLQMLKNIVKHGPKRIFTAKKRDTRPNILSDPSFGTHNFARLEKGIKLHYVAKGSESKPLMLFLHGFPEFWLSWRHQLKEFSADFRAVAVDMRGYSESDKPSGIANYVMDHLVDDIKQLIPALGYERCVLCAHDWGGAVAFAFARMYPDMVQKLIVCNCPSGPSFQKFLQRDRAQFRKSWYMFFFQMPWFPETFIRLGDYFMLAQIFADLRGKNGEPNMMSDEEMEAFKYTFSRPGALTPPIDYYRAAMRIKPTLKYPTDKVKVPTMMLWGTEDTALSKELAVLTAADVEDYRYHYIEGASHWVQQHRPHDVNAHIRDFLREASSGSSGSRGGASNE